MIFNINIIFFSMNNSSRDERNARIMKNCEKILFKGKKIIVQRTVIFNMRFL